MSAAAGMVILGGAPLGNVADASPRLVQALASVDVIAAEDTRRVRRLCADLGVTPAGRIVSFFDANETSRLPQLMDALEDGRDVLVISDAGMPSVSDPGYRLVAAAIARDVRVTVLPGPSAVTAAVAVSGLPVDRFCFEGFLPRKAIPRRRAIESLTGEPRTMVFFEAAHRLGAMLADLRDVLGADREAAICREMTKTYEEVRRGSLATLSRWATDAVRGEITVVVAGASQAAVTATAEQLAAAVAAAEATGQSRKDAIAAVAQGHRLPKRVVYDAVVSPKADARV